MVLVVDEQRALPHLDHVDDLGGAVLANSHAARSVGTEPHGLAVPEVDATLLGLTHGVERTVVVDVAVLEDLDERGAAMRRSPPQHLGHVLAVGVDRARDEARLGADGDAERVEGLVDRACGRRARPLAPWARRRVLPLRQPVDLVVEKEDRDIHIAPQGVDEVVAADRERVAVPRDDPDGEVGTRGGEPGRDRGRTAVDRVHPVRLHVVREAGGAADAGDEDDALARDAELGHELLDGGEDRIVAAARAPADLLVGLQVLRRQCQLAVAVAFCHNIAPIASPNSLARKGTPRTRL
jgi:hypothetical protein